VVREAVAVAHRFFVLLFERLRGTCLGYARGGARRTSVYVAPARRR
jgi:protein tyrosine phosphatase (PTP) superfamily phosphohydrolase (DUF442 family)